ncbi:hypothetical protein CDD82_5373 [Ophiocordyceps australis]|uniref:Nucleoporin Nup82 n=1 Tax=Ophiocordyceps australis TaxID=1399860 RepID=A0A2C5Z329_9HYPO|nr:hypothetical protein CDD82_5373 [Ophiocordyceps australis]
MPKVKQYSAAWLSRNAPGHQLFETSPESQKPRTLSSSHLPKNNFVLGPRRTIVRRGTEVFVAVGKEIRWADLVYVKDQWLSNQPSSNASHGSPSPAKNPNVLESIDGHAGLVSGNGFRILKLPVASEIRQLIMSPNSTRLAILTSHTVHICVLPDSSHLTSVDTAPIRPKIFTLGPTTHVTSRSPIMSALWHPLGVKGSCIVTVTADAIVRIWELTDNRWSYDTPSSSIDLRKLADGVVLEQDFAASQSTTNTAFSPDTFEMEVASAAFAARESGGWDSMTLWIAMREGDLYALCPVLPERWAPPPTLIPSLSVSIVTKLGALEDDPEADETEKLLVQQQLQWMGDIDKQEPHIIHGVADEPDVEVYKRPRLPGAVPRLQGPLFLDCDPETGDELDSRLTDILVIGKKTETEELMRGEDEDEELELDDGEQQGLSLAIVCIVSTSGQVRIYLDIEGIEAQWLPPKSKPLGARTLPPPPEAPCLLAIQALDTMKTIEIHEEAWPVFSTDATSRYNLFVTHHVAITFLSLASWVFRLERELNGDNKAGTDFRISLLAHGQSTNRQRIYEVPPIDVASPLAASVSIRDPDLGYFLLSATPYDPIALTLETPDMDFMPIKREGTMEDETAMAPLEFHEARPAFTLPHAFDQDSALPVLLERLSTSRHRVMVNKEVRLSPLTLQIFTNAHKVVSDETFSLGVSAAEVFRRCLRLQEELRQQVHKANEVKAKIEQINGSSRQDGETDDENHVRRINEAKKRQQKLLDKVDGMRRLAGRARGRELSLKERSLIGEVKALESAICGPTQGDEGETKQHPKRDLWKRLEEVKKLHSEVMSEVEEAEKARAEQEMTTPTGPKIGRDIRQGKMQQVQGLLSRESALFEALTARVERLQSGRVEEDF